MLSKSSAPSWSDKQLYKISNVIPAKGTMAPKYHIKGISDYLFVQVYAQRCSNSKRPQPLNIPKGMRKAKAKLSAEEARHLLRNGKRTLVNGGFIRISDSDDSRSEEDKDER